MPHRTQGFERNQFYHIFNRGNNKEKIFFERKNYRFFLQKFVHYLPPKAVEIHAYCLMPNHYHFLVRLIEDFNYSRAMQHLAISYVKSINSWYERSGHLFQGRFSGRLVDSTEYLLHLSRYIHLNPLTAKLVASAQDWEFSSYRDYLLTADISQGTDQGQSLSAGGFQRPEIHTNVILSILGGLAEYRKFVESYEEGDLKRLEENW
jgi:putative transposase